MITVTDYLYIGLILMITWISAFLSAFAAILWLLAMSVSFGIGGFIFFGLIPSLLLADLAQHQFNSFNKWVRNVR